MSDIFLSYAREDLPRVRQAALGLAHAGFDVFWDRSILEGLDFTQVIEKNLAEARCVVVFWSKHSTASRWVKAEAGWGDDRRRLVEVQLDASKPPLPFGRSQLVDMRRWTKGRSSPAFRKLLATVRHRVHPEQGLGELDPVPRSETITEDHLFIVHTCWRAESEREEQWRKTMRDPGLELYKFEIVVCGHRTSLDRIERVTWYLHPFYDEYSQSIVPLDRRSRPSSFRHRELAWGESVVRASVKIQDQVELVRLSRFINLMEAGEELAGVYY